MKRAIKIDGLGTELVISVATALYRLTPCIYLEEFENGTWRLTYCAETFPDFSTIKRFAFADLNVNVKQKNAVRLRVNVITNSKEQESDSISESFIVSKISAIDVGDMAKQNSRFLYLKYLSASNSWSLLYRQDLIPDLSKVTGLSMIRED